MQVKVDELLAEKRKEVTLQKEKEKETLKKLIPPKIKNNGKVFMSKRPKMNFDKYFPELNNTSNALISQEIPNGDFNATFKDQVFKMSSYTMKNPEKRKKFEEKLKDSSFLRAYIDKRGAKFIDSYFNVDFKALTLYGLKYLEVYNTNPVSKP